MAKKTAAPKKEAPEEVPVEAVADEPAEKVFHRIGVRNDADKQFSLSAQHAYLEGYLNHFFPLEEGETEDDRNIRIRMNGELTPKELYAWSEGLFLSCTDKLYIKLIGGDPPSGKKPVMKKYKSVLMQTERHTARASAGGTAYYGRMRLEAEGDPATGKIVTAGANPSQFKRNITVKNMMIFLHEKVVEFAQKANAKVPVAQYIRVFGDDLELKDITGQLYCDVWESATARQRECILHMALLDCREKLLNDPMYMKRGEPQGAAINSGYWSEGVDERAQDSAERALTEARESYHAAFGVYPE